MNILPNQTSVKTKSPPFSQVPDVAAKLQFSDLLGLEMYDFSHVATEKIGPLVDDEHFLFEFGPLSFLGGHIYIYIYIGFQGWGYSVLEFC